jgi:hypothetical protein
MDNFDRNPNLGVRINLNNQYMGIEESPKQVLKHFLNCHAYLVFMEDDDFIVEMIQLGLCSNKNFNQTQIQELRNSVRFMLG